jgi:hypothetical protein
VTSSTHPGVRLQVVDVTRKDPDLVTVRLRVSNRSGDRVSLAFDLTRSRVRQEGVFYLPLSVQSGVAFITRDVDINGDTEFEVEFKGGFTPGVSTILLAATAGAPEFPAILITPRR